MAHLTALTRLHTTGALSYNYDNNLPRVPDGLRLGKNDVLPPNLVSLCAASCDASLKPLLALKSLHKLSLAGLPQLLPARSSGQAGGSDSEDSEEEQHEAEAEAAAVQLLQERLPGVEVKVAKMLYGIGEKVDCHCCCSHTV